MSSLNAAGENPQRSATRQSRDHQMIGNSVKLPFSLTQNSSPGPGQLSSQSTDQLPVVDEEAKLLTNQLIGTRQEEQLIDKHQTQDFTGQRQTNQLIPSTRLGDQLSNLRRGSTRGRWRTASYSGGDLLSAGRHLPDIAGLGFFSLGPRPQDSLDALQVQYTSVAEPEPQGAASFGRSRSHNAMRLRLRRSGSDALAPTILLNMYRN
jgi:hypothetical protein